MEELQQKVNSMSQELGLFQLNELKRDEELNKKLKTLEVKLSELDLRIKMLEEARVRQIALNTDLINKTKTEKPIEKSIEKPKSLWDIFFK